MKYIMKSNNDTILLKKKWNCLLCIYIYDHDDIKNNDTNLFDNVEEDNMFAENESIQKK